MDTGQKVLGQLLKHSNFSYILSITFDTIKLITNLRNTVLIFQLLYKIQVENPIILNRILKYLVTFQYC